MVIARQTRVALCKWLGLTRNTQEVWSPEAYRQGIRT